MTSPFSSPSRKHRRVLVAALAALPGLAVIAQRPAAAASEMEAEAPERAAFVLLAAGGQSSTMSGSMQDLERAKALRVGREGLLYVRTGGAGYVIRDAATLRQAELIFAPQQALGARQAALGSRQAALGKRQAELGAQQARLGARQAAASPRAAGELGRQQGLLGRQQDVLGRQQGELGTEQAQLGREQHRLGIEADAKIRALVADAIRSGVARRVD